MRDIVILVGILALIPMILRRPYIGVLAWTWIAILNPHREAFGFSTSLRPNLIIVLVTLIAFVISSERKSWPGGKLAMSFAAFIGWTTLTAVIAPDREASLEFYNDFVVKMAIHMVILLVVINTPHRLISLVWTYALSLGYHAVKIGLVTIYSGFVIGRYTGFGPADTMIDDRNHFAIAMLMLAPILFFLWKHANHKIMRNFALAGMAMCFLAVIGSFSRGGMLTMAAMMFFLWTKTNHKFASALLIGVLVLGAVSFVPSEYKARISTTFDQFSGQESAYEDENELDESFCLRVANWQLGFDMALDSPIFGHGLRSIQNHNVATDYLSDDHICSHKAKYRVRAAHNIYVEVITDSGFPGLFLFLFILVGSWLTCGRIARMAKSRADLLWAHDLAAMMQVSITGYAIGGVLLSLAYYDGYFLIVSMVIVLHRIVKEAVGEAEPRRGDARPARRRRSGGGTVPAE